MAKLKIRKNIEIPLSYPPSGTPKIVSHPDQMALDLSPYHYLRLELLEKEGGWVYKGQPIVRDKKFPKRQFVSPCHGQIKEIKRGTRRALTEIILEYSSEKTIENSIPSDAKDPKELIDSFLYHGLGTLIRKRPFGTLITDQLPKAIFLDLTRKSLYQPPFGLQIEGYELFFEKALSILQKISPSQLFVLGNSKETDNFFANREEIGYLSCEGNVYSAISFAIQRNTPIQSIDEIIWELDLMGAISIGRFFCEGTYHTDRLVGVGGTQEHSGFYKSSLGSPVHHLLPDLASDLHIVMGDPLLGRRGNSDSVLTSSEDVISLIPQEKKREWFYFLKPGWKKFTATRAYLSWLSPKKQFLWTSSKNGEERAFIDEMIYQKVMPLSIPVAPLIKALLAKEYEEAIKLGFLELQRDDLALATFICPSKIDLMGIFDESAKKYAQEQLSLI